MTNSTFCYLTIGVFALAFVIALFYIVKWVKACVNVISVSRNKGAVETIRLHRSVILLMEQMMRAYGGHDVEMEKLAVIGNYINLTIKDEEQRDESFKMLKETVRKNRRSDVCVMVMKYIDSMKDELPTSTDKYRLAHGLDVSEYAPDDKLDTQGFLNDLKCYELAEELTTHLNPFQQKYVVYLLLHMAMTDGSLSSKAEKTLKTTCVNGLKLPEGDFEDLCNATKNNQLDDWFQQNIQAAQPSTALHSDDLLNIFADEEKGNEVNDTKLSLFPLRKVVLWPSVLQVVLSFALAWDSVGFLSNFGIIAGVSVIFITAIFQEYSKFASYIPDYETYGILFLRKDIKRA